MTNTVEMTEGEILALRASEAATERLVGSELPPDDGTVVSALKGLIYISSRVADQVEARKGKDNGSLEHQLAIARIQRDDAWRENEVLRDKLECCQADLRDLREATGYVG